MVVVDGCVNISNIVLHAGTFVIRCIYRNRFKIFEAVPHKYIDIEFSKTMQVDCFNFGLAFKKFCSSYLAVFT